MERRNFLKFLGISAAAPVAAKAGALTQVEDDVKSVIADAIGVPKGDIITELTRGDGVIHLSQAVCVEINYDNSLRSMMAIGGSERVDVRAGKLSVMLSAEFLADKDFFGLISAGVPIAVINDNPQLKGTLPQHFKAMIGNASVSAHHDEAVLVSIDMVML